MKIDELIENKLLIKTKTTEQEIIGSLTIAEKYIEKAKGNIKIEYFDVAFSLAINQCFTLHDHYYSKIILKKEVTLH